MNSALAIALILTTLAILITAAMAIIAVGHQTEERPGTIDLTGMKVRHVQSDLASRVRAEAAPVVRVPMQLGVMVDFAESAAWDVPSVEHVWRTASNGCVSCSRCGLVATEGEVAGHYTPPACFARSGADAA